MISFSNFLFVPGNRPDRIAKGLATDADLICIDLEDSVPASEKDSARAIAFEAISKADRSRAALRINGLRTEAGLRDLLGFMNNDLAPQILFLPMVESPAEIDIVRNVLADDSVAIIPLIETVQGLRNADEIASAAGVAAMMFGGGDFSSQLGVKLEWDALLGARSNFIMSCASAQIMAIDVPYIVIDDEDGLIEESNRAKTLGFHAKAAIHPKQIAAISKAMRPSEKEVEEATAAVEAYEEAGSRAIRFRGRMLEAPIMTRYRQILASANRINN